MRCLIEIARTPGGWSISYRDPNTRAELVPPRQLVPCTQEQRFPAPGGHAAEACEADAHRLCTDLTGRATKMLFDKISRLDVATKDVRSFGRYLTHVLLGENWAALQQTAGTAAAAKAAPPIELELAFSEDAGLASLPWESMHDAGGPLGAQKGRTVAITRIIGPAAPIGPIAPVKLPLRVLFIVGRQIDDQLRPGAELIGLLRRIQIPTGTHFETQDLNVKYLSDATWDEIQNAVGQFKPTVVHIVSHGTVGDQPRLLLTKRKDEADPTSDKLLSDPYQCSAARLAELLDNAGTLPPVVIVNACHTADKAQEMQETVKTQAFAAELVHRGVAMAVGMSGEVADRACQLFTLRFYHSLLQQGLSVSLAAAQGRRAALLGFADYLESVDWARPALFLARGVSPILDIRLPAQNLSAIAARFRQLNHPEAFCDRYEFLERYEQRRRSDPGRADAAPVMAIASKDAGLGKSRLLEEMAARSILDRCAPVMVRAKIGPQQPPSHPLEFALRIGEATQETRAHFEINPRRLTRAEELGFRVAGLKPNPPDDAELDAQRIEFRRRFRSSQAASDVNLAEVIRAIQTDCEHLRQDIEAASGEPYRILIMLDDLNRYANLGRDIVEYARSFGLGSAAFPLPLVFTYSATDTDGRALEEYLRERRDIHHETLAAIESEQDQKLAFSQLVLSCWKLAINRRPDKAQSVRFFFEDMVEYTKGRPVQFTDPIVEASVRTHSRYEALVTANFDAVLRQWS